MFEYEFPRDKSIYEYYVCPRCFHQLTNCTCESYPHYSIKWVDKGIQEHVRILNEKGYKTEYSCESHNARDTLHISFYNQYGFGETISLPEGFEKRNSYNMIEHKYGKDSKARKKMTEEEFEEEKQKHLNILLEWVKSLPEQTDKNKRRNQIF